MDQHCILVDVEYLEIFGKVRISCVFQFKLATFNEIVLGS